MTLDNALKILITIVLGMIGYMQQRSDNRLESVEKDVVSIREAVSELRTAIKYIGGKNASGLQNGGDPFSLGRAGDQPVANGVPN